MTTISAPTSRPPHDGSRAALTEAWAAQETIVVPAVAYAECMVRPLKAGGRSLALADAFFATQRVEPLTREATRTAGALRARFRSLRMPDALILGSAVELRADTVLTADESCARSRHTPRRRRAPVTEKLYAIIHEADGDTIWRWQTGRKARFVEYGGYQKAKGLAEAAGSILALWGSQYGHRGVPGDASEADIQAAVDYAIERRDTHS